MAQGAQIHSIEDVKISPSEIPGKVSSPAPKFPTGDARIDTKGACHDAPVSKACFLDAEQRQNLFDTLDKVLTRAEQAHKDALNALKVDTVLLKEEDPHWLVQVGLDVLSTTLVGFIAKGAAKVTGGLAGDRAKAAVRLVMDQGKKRASAALKLADNLDLNSRKTSTLHYLDMLRQEAHSSFAALDRAIPTLSDADLLTIFHAFDDEAAHEQAVYENAFREKVARFQKSGVTDIGRKRNPERDTRVVKVFYSSGHPTEVRYQRADASRWGLRQWDESEADFGALDKDIGVRAPELGEIVPDEFAEIALVQQEHVWGTKDKTDYLIINESDFPQSQYGFDRWWKAYKNTKAPKKPKPDPARGAPLPKALASASTDAPVRDGVNPVHPTSRKAP